MDDSRMTLGQFEHRLHQRLREAIDQDDLRQHPLDEVDEQVKERVREAVESLGLGVPVDVETRLEYSYPPLRTAVITKLSVSLPSSREPFQGDGGAGEGEHEGEHHHGEHRHEGHEHGHHEGHEHGEHQPAWEHSPS